MEEALQQLRRAVRGLGETVEEGMRERSRQLDVLAVDAGVFCGVVHSVRHRLL